MKVQSLIAALVLSLGGVAFAQTAPAPKDPASTPRVDQRQVNQQKRIDQGVASGSLTTTEAQRLEAQQARIAAGEDKAKADGKVTKKERAKLHARQDKASRKIARQKHDAQTQNAPAQQ